MWRYVCFRIHSRHSVLEFQASTPYQKLEAPESRSMLHQFCIMLVSCPSLRCSCRKKTSLMQRSKGFGHGVVVSKICYVQYSDCVQWFGLPGIDCALSCDTWLLQTNEIQCTIIVEIDKIEILASVGWKWGCQPFSCPCSLNVMHCRKEICLTCLSKESIPFVKSKPPLPTRSLRSLRAAVCSTNSALCLYHAHPFVAAAEKNESHAEKQRVWSRSCGLQDLLCTMQWLCPRFGLPGIDCALSCDTWLLQTNEIQWAVVEIDKIEILVSVGWKWGCQPFSCPCSLNVMHCRKEICLTCLSKESMPFVKSKPPLPTRSLRFLRAAVCCRSTNSALSLYHAHPFVAAAEKRSVSCREAKGLVTELWSPRIVAIYW